MKESSVGDAHAALFDFYDASRGGAGLQFTSSTASAVPLPRKDSEELGVTCSIKESMLPLTNTPIDY